jgi:transposase
MGALGATAIVATAADPTVFRSARDFAARIGLVPRQDSTGASGSSGGRGRRRVFPRAADALDVDSISCVTLIGRTSLREALALDVRVVLLVIRAVHLRPDMLTPTAAE